MFDQTPLSQCLVAAQVSGNCMGIVGTVISVIIFRNKISIGGIVGYGITIGTTATNLPEALKPLGRTYCTKEDADYKPHV